MSRRSTSDKKSLSTTKSSSMTQAKKKKDIRPNYCTIRWKKQQQSERLLATNMIMEIARVAPTENDFEEHKHTLSIDDIRAIAALKPSRKYSNLDMSPEAISTEMIQLCINTLTSDAVTPEEQVLGYFT